MRLAASLLLLLVLATGCACHTIDHCDYDAIGIGEPLSVVIEKCGQPLQIADCKNGKKQYIYVTHEEPGAHVRALSRYVIVVENDVVVDKWNENEEEDLSTMDEQMSRDYGL